MFIVFNKSKEIYTFVIAHRGFHLGSPENTLAAYRTAVNCNYAIEFDVRILKDKKIVCFHDRYMKRLLGVPGNIQHQSYRNVKKYRVQNSDQKIPTLAEALKCIDAKVPILIEIKGLWGIKNIDKLRKILSRYKGKLYFHTKNLITYYFLSYFFPKKVFWILNPLRKRFNFLKGRAYANLPVLPKLDDLIVGMEYDSGKIIKKIWSICNKYKTRVNSSHWLLNYNGGKFQIAHRAIVNPSIKEHSKQAFEECVRRNKVIEFDVSMHKGKILIYHSDRISSKLGQEASCAEKCVLNDSVRFEEVLKIIDGKVPFILDIKDYHLFSRKFENKLIEQLDKYNGEFSVQSFNPLVLRYFKKKKPEYIRGQIGNSLKKLSTLQKFILPIVNFCLFYYGDPDYIVYDLDKSVLALSNFNKVVGLPVLGYAPKKYKDIIPYLDYFDNFIVEGDWKVKK